MAHPSELHDLHSTERLISRLSPPAIGLRNATGRVAILHQTCIHIEGFECHHERTVRPIQLRPSVVRCPVLAVPDRAVDSHWLLVGERYSDVFVVFVYTDRCCVHVESAAHRSTANEHLQVPENTDIGLVWWGCLHDLLLVPYDGVRVKICCGIEPKVDTLLPFPLPVCVHIRLQNVWLP